MSGYLRLVHHQAGGAQVLGLHGNRAGRARHPADQRLPRGVGRHPRVVLAVRVAHVRQSRGEGVVGVREDGKRPHEMSRAHLVPGTRGGGGGGGRGLCQQHTGTCITYLFIY
jgi:hypothetical protein